MGNPLFFYLEELLRQIPNNIVMPDIYTETRGVEMKQKKNDVNFCKGAVLRLFLNFFFYLFATH